MLQGYKRTRYTFKDSVTYSEETLIIWQVKEVGAQLEGKKGGILGHTVSNDGFKATHDMKLAPMVLQ